MEGMSGGLEESKFVVLHGQRLVEEFGWTFTESLFAERQ